MVHDISLTIPKGKLVALAGLAGDGQNDLLEGLAGLRPSRGNLTLDGHEFSALRSVAAGIRHGATIAGKIEQMDTATRRRHCQRFEQGSPDVTAHPPAMNQDQIVHP